MEALAKDAVSIPAEGRIHLHFALAKAYEDVDRAECAFQQLLAGNRLKRQQIGYDEAATLAMLDRVQERFTPDLIKAHEGYGEPSRVPVFIVGMPRSGTTLIEQILASHPLMFGAGELRLFDEIRTGILNVLPQSAALPEMVANMTGEQVRTVGARYLAALQQFAPDAARITDKMPSNFLFAGLIHLALPNAIIIHAVRDPIDTCVSCFAKHFVKGHPYTYDLAELGRYYRHYQALMAHWHRVLPAGRILDVRYEDVVADLEGAARRIVDHCGLAWDPDCLAFHQTERPVRTASATQVRQPIYCNSVGRWRRYAALLPPLLAELQLGASSVFADERAMIKPN
jgi:Sulfotransferase family